MSSAFDTGAGKQLSQLPSAARSSRFSKRSTLRWTGPGPVLDEILCMSILLPLAETGDLLHGRIPQRGVRWPEKSLLLPLPLEDPGTCAHCGNTLDQPTWRTYSCPRKCGLSSKMVACPEVWGSVCRPQLPPLQGRGPQGKLDTAAARPPDPGRPVGLQNGAGEATLGGHGGRWANVDPLGKGGIHLDRWPSEAETNRRA